MLAENNLQAEIFRHNNFVTKQKPKPQQNLKAKKEDMLTVIYQSFFVNSFYWEST